MQDLPHDHDSAASAMDAVAEKADHYYHEKENTHGHGHGHRPDGHTHGVVDPRILASERGIWAVKWSFVGLGVTALVQFAIALATSSVALLADTIHNVGDAGTALPLWLAFALSQRKPGQRFTYGYGRVEDLAGIAVVAIILCSALVAGYESIDRLINPKQVEHVWAVAIAALIGFAGNEAVAVFRIRVGRQMRSAALVADGYHARADGLASLSVLVGAAGAWLGFPVADPIVGFLITALILKIVWDSAKPIFLRALDGIDATVLEEIRHSIAQTDGVRSIGELRGRWIGHRLQAEANIAVDGRISLEKAHEIAIAARHNLLHQLEYLDNVTIHVDPEHRSGEEHHRFQNHGHDGLPTHSHR